MLIGFDDFYVEDAVSIDDADGNSLKLRTVIVPDEDM